MHAYAPLFKHGAADIACTLDAAGRCTSGVYILTCSQFFLQRVQTSAHHSVAQNRTRLHIMTEQTPIPGACQTAHLTCCPSWTWAEPHHPTSIMRMSVGSWGVGLPVAFGTVPPSRSAGSLGHAAGARLPILSSMLLLPRTSIGHAITCHSDCHVHHSGGVTWLRSQVVHTMLSNTGCFESLLHRSL